MPRKLSVVGPGAPPPPPPPPERLSVAQAAQSGDRRKLLVALRERIAQAVSSPSCPPRDLAALTRRLQDVAREIESLDLEVEREGSREVVPDEEFDSSAL